MLLMAAKCCSRASSRANHINLIVRQLYAAPCCRVCACMFSY